jgi:DNA replication and repair protein RecF
VRIESLLLRNFRNYQEQFIQWHPNINLITGLNGQGKSNLIEACCYFSLASSYRDSSDVDLIRWQEPYFFLCAGVRGRDPFSGEETPLEMSVGYTREKRKLWKINGKALKKTSQVLGHFQTVIFSPEDLSLVKDGPAIRRKFLNRELLQLDGEFYPVYSAYRQSVEQRNKYLKQSYGETDPEMLAVWDEELSRHGSAILLKRQQLLEDILPFAEKIHRLLSDGKEYIHLSYEAALFRQKEQNDEVWQTLARMKKDHTSSSTQQDFLKEQLKLALERNRREDLYKGTTGVGPHRDDIAITINGISARQFGSQGQQRTAALALKLAEIDLFHQKSGQYPVLLLDDVASELDEKRCQQLLKLVGEKTQTLITDTKMNIFSHYGKTIIIDGGIVK